MLPFVKLNNVRDLADARFAAAIPAEWIGFGVGNTDSLSIQNIQEIIGWCSGPKLILEVADSTSAEIVVSYCRILPVKGIECSANDLAVYQNLPETEGLIFMVKNGMNHSKQILSHLELDSISKPTEHTIYKVSPTDENAAWLNQNEVFAISLNCFESAGTGMKDYGNWNDFLENIGFFE